MIRVPRSHTFPGGFKMKVRHVSAETLDAINGDCGALDSLWVWEDGAGGTLYLQRGRKPFLKIQDFTHEFVHAANDWRTWYERKAGGKG